jgi:hypothetical protein
MEITDKQDAGLEMIAGDAGVERFRQAATRSGGGAPCSRAPGTGDHPFSFDRTNRRIDTARSDE